MVKTFVVIGLLLAMSGALAQNLTAKATLVTACRGQSTMAGIQWKRKAAGAAPMAASPEMAAQIPRYLKVLYAWTDDYAINKAPSVEVARLVAFSMCTDNLDRLIREDKAGFATLQVR